MEKPLTILVGSQKQQNLCLLHFVQGPFGVCRDPGIVEYGFRWAGLINTNEIHRKHWQLTEQDVSGKCLCKLVIKIC